MEEPPQYNMYPQYGDPHYNVHQQNGDTGNYKTTRKLFHYTFWVNTFLLILEEFKTEKTPFSLY